MPNFSDDQLIAIAQQFHDLSVAVSQFRLDRIRGGLPLDDPGIVQLFGLQQSLSDTSSSFDVQAAQVTLADADQAAAQITAASKEAIGAVKTLQLVNKVINIASAAGVLAAAIMTGKMDQIGDAAKAVYAAAGS
jgi:hypothetical protein